MWTYAHRPKFLKDFRATNWPINGLFVRIQEKLIPRSTNKWVNPAATLYQLTLRAFYVAGSVLGALCTISDLILITQCGRPSYYTHFTDDRTEDEK